MISTTAWKNNATVSVSQNESVVAASENATNFVMNVSRADIANYAREGGDLIIELKNGRTVRIKDFFLNGYDYNYLILSDGGYFLVDMSDAAGNADGIDDPKVAYIPLDDHDPALLVLLYGVASIGLAALLANDSHGHAEEKHAPGAPTAHITDSGTGEITVSGQAEPGSTVTVTLPDGSTYTTIANPNGDYTVNAPAPQGDGTIYVTATNDAGASTPTEVDYNDITPPNVPTANITDTGSGEITVSGQAEPGSTVTVTLPDGSTHTTTADENGDYSVDVPAPQGDGTIVVTATDEAGNISDPGEAEYHDITPPGVPTANITDTGTGEITVSGQAEPGSTVTVTLPDGSTHTTTADENGDYTIDVPAPQGDGTIYVTATDEAGNTSDPGEAEYYDITPPGVPTANITDTGMGEITVSGQAEPGSTVTVTLPDGSTHTTTADENGEYTVDVPAPMGDGTIFVTATDEAGNTSDPSEAEYYDITPPGVPTANITDTGTGEITVSGQAEPGSTVTVILLDGSTHTTTADGNGEYTIDVPAPQGDGTIYVTATDEAGNTSDPGEAEYYDITPPGVPTANITDTGTGEITVSGQAEPGSTVTVTLPDGSTHTTTADENGDYTIDVPAPQGDGTIYVTATDEAGNTSDPGEAEYYDITPPGVPTANITDTGSGEITVSGQAEPGSTVTVTLPDGSTHTTTADENGDYTIDVPAPMGDGTIYVTATDEAGNTSDPGEAEYYDITPPGVPTANITDTGTGEITVSGQAEPGSTVTVTLPDGSTHTTTADENGEYTIDVPAPQGDGTIYVTATDEAGNTSDPGEAEYHDITPPGIPTANITDTGTGEITVSGQAEPGSTVTVTLPDGSTHTTTADVNGEYTIDVPAPQGDGTIYVTATDEAGNTSDPGEAEYHDITPPGIPTANITDTGTGEITVSGQAEPGSTVTVTLPDGSTHTTTADDNGEYTVDVPAPMGDGTIYVTATDEAGNTSGPGEAEYHDITPPDAPTANITDTGTGEITVSGQAEPGSTVTVTLPDGSTHTTTADPNGDYSVDVPAPNGDSTIYVTATDEAGNTSKPGEADYHDITPPTGAATIDGYYDDVAPVLGLFGNNTSTNDSSPLLQGTVNGLAQGDVVKVFEGATLIGQATVVGTGWSLQLANVSEGPHSYTVAVVDPAGNKGALSTPFNLTVDLTPPSLVTNLDLYDDIAPIIGTIVPGTETDDNRPTYSGKADADTVRVNVYDNGNYLGSAQVQANGSWSFEPSTALASGPHNFVAKPVDAAGNEGPGSAPWNFTLAGPAPAQPAITKVEDNAGSVTGPLQKLDTTDDATPTISGTGTPGSVVKIFVDGVEAGSAMVAGDGTWSVTTASLGADGLKNITAQAFDGAGQESEPTDPYPIVLDTTPPAKPGVAAALDRVGEVTGAIIDGGTTDDSQPLFSGMGEVGATVTIYDNGVVIGTTTVDATGKWTFTPPTPLGDTNHAITTTQTDKAGNTSEASDALNFTVDTSQVVVSITKAIDDYGAITGDILNGQATDDPTPTLAGTGTPNALVTISENGVTLGSVTVDPTGKWSFTLPEQGEGTHTYMATAKNAAGTEGTASFGLTIILTPPDVPAIAKVEDDVGLYKGYLADYDHTDDTTPTLYGSGATPDDAINVYDTHNGKTVLLGSVKVDANGNWNYTPISTLNEGDHILQVSAVDPVGNESGKSAPFHLTIDTTSPDAKATISSITDDTGESATDFVTSDTTLLINATVDKAIAADEKVQISLDNGKTWHDAAWIHGNEYQYDAQHTPLAQGAYTFQARVIDAAGNAGAASSQTVLISTTGSSTTVKIDGIDVDSGVIGDFITNDNDGLTIHATLSAALKPGEKLMYSRDDGATWIDITSAVSGLDVSYADLALRRSATIKMQVVDLAGNGGPVASQAITILGDSPSTTVVIDGITEDSGVVGDFITNDKDGLIIHATLSEALQAGETLKYSTDGTTWIDITSSVSGKSVNYFDATLTSSKTIYMQVENAAGLAGSQASKLITIISTPPGTTVAITGIDVDSGVVGDFITNDNDGLSIYAKLSAALKPGEKLMYSHDNGASWIDITSAVSGTNVSYFDSLLTASATIQMKVVDIADNAGAVASQLITIDITPSPVTVAITGIDPDTGVVGDFITSATTGLTVMGKLSGTGLEAGDKLMYSRDGGATWIDITAAVSGTGVSYFDPNLVKSATVMMRVVDVAGNNGSQASQLIEIIGTGPGTSVQITGIDVDSGVIGDFITNDNDGLSIYAKLSAALKPGEKLTYSTDGVNWTDITGSVSGLNVEYFDSKLTSSKTVYMRVEDLAGNHGPQASQIITIDTTPPTTTVAITGISVDSGIVGDFVTNDNDGLTIYAKLSGTGLQTGDKLMYSRDNGATWIDITGSVSGTSVSFDDPLLTSSATIKMRVEDQAANAGVETSQLITIDTTPPTTTVTITGIDVDSGTPGDFITHDNDGLSIFAKLSAALQAGEGLEYSRDGGNTWIDITSAVSGVDVSYFDALLTQSTTIKMRVVDLAHNTGAETQRAIVIDNTPPDISGVMLGFDKITGDDVINGSEASGNVTISGTLTGVPADAISKLIVVTVNGVDYTAALSGNTWSVSVSGSDLVNDNDHVVDAKLTMADAAGNTASVATSHGYLVDLSQASISIDTPIAGDDWVSAAEKASVMLSGATSGVNAGQTVTLTISDSNAATPDVIVTAIVGADGKWSASTAADLSGLDDGTLTVKAEVLSSPGGNPASDSKTIGKDTVAPTQTVDIVSVNPDTGAADFVTSAQKLSFAGTISSALGAGEKVQISLDGGKTWLDASTAGMNWTYDNSANTLPAGAYDIQARVIDTAGNVGATAQQMLVIDITPPSTTVKIDGIDVDSGVIGDFITNDNDGLTIHATLSAALKPGEKLMYSHDNGASWINITSAVSGMAVTYFDAALTSTATIKMRVDDQAANAGAETSQLITIDTTPPSTTVVITGIDEDTGIVGDFITSDTDGLTVFAKLSAALEAGEKLMYSRDNGATWIDITSAVSGLDVSYADLALRRSATIKMQVVDPAGNGGPLASQAITILGDSPSTTVVIDGITEDSGVVGDFITNDKDGLIIHATLSEALQAGETLKYSTDGTNWIDITSSVSGKSVNYFDATLTSSKTIYMQVENAAGLAGSQASKLITIISTPPGTTVAITGIDVDSGVVGDFITNDNDGLSIYAKLSAALKPGEKLMYSHDNGASWIDISSAVSGTNVSYFDSLLTASATIQMKVVDIADNAGAVASQLITIDITPSPVTVAITGIDPDTGVVGDFITSATTGLTVMGKLSGTGLEAGDKLMYSRDGGATWIDITAAVNGTGVSYFDPNLVKSATVMMRVVDVAGNNGSQASQLIEIIGTGPGTSVQITGIDVDSGVIGDFITNDNDGLSIYAKLSAALKPGETLKYSTDGTNWIDITGSVSGLNVEYFDSKLTSSKTVYMRVEDLAGNHGPQASQIITIDTTPPTTTVTITGISVDSGIVGDFVTNDNDGLTIYAKLSGTGLQAGDKLMYSRDNGATWIDITGSVSGTSVSFDDPLLTSSTTIKMRVEDQAANAGIETSQLITIDTTPPTTTVTITGIDVDSGTPGDFVTNDNDGLNIYAKLSAALQAGEGLEYSRDGGNSWIDITSAVSGVDVNYFDALLTQSTTIKMRVVDLAHNTGVETQRAIVIDNTPPDTTVQITGIDVDSGVVGDFITNDNDGLTIHATLSAALQAGDKLMYSHDNGATWIDISSAVSGLAVNYFDASLTSTATIKMRVDDLAGNLGAEASQLITIDTTPPATIATILSYTDDVGVVQGQFGSNTTTDDRQPTLNGTLDADLAAGERVAVYDGGVFIGNATMAGPRDWSLDLPSLDDKSTHSYTAKVIDVAGNAGAVSNSFVIHVELAVLVNSQNTLDTTPIVTGSTGFDILPGEYLEVTINGVTYSSQDGKVVVDLQNNTWYVQIPDEYALTAGKYYDVAAVLKNSSGATVTTDKSFNELYVAAPPAPPSPPVTADSDNKATAMTIGETGGWRLFANQAVMDANGTDSTNVTSLKINVLTGNSGVLGSATFIDFDRDGLMDIIGADSQFQDGQQGYKYIPGSSQTLTSANAYGAANIGKTNVDYEAFQMGWPGQPNDYAGTGSVKYSGTGPGGSTSTEYSANCYSWYGGVAGYDKGGNGYVDVIFGDNTPNDNEARGGYDTSFVVNNQGIFNKDPSLVFDATGAPRDKFVESRQATPEKVVSTVDLNNDGMVDIVFGANAGTNFLSARGDSATNRTGNSSRLVVASDDGSGNLKVVQIVENMLYDREGTTFDGQSMTWADFDGDGYMDLFQSVGYGTTVANENISRIYFNDAGRISAATTNAGGYQTGAGRSYSMTYTATAPVMKGGGSVAVDWNADGRMDIIEIPYYDGANPGTSGVQNVLLYNNQTNGGVVKFDTSLLTTVPKQGSGSAITGLLAIDLDWDGDKDLILFTGTKGSYYVENKVQIAYGTAMHVKILDAEGINSLYGNTVQLFDSHGKLVSTQIINPQSGNQTNDSSALVDFYGLDANETYSVVLLRAVGGQSSDVGGLANLGGNAIENVNAAWTGLKAGEANHCYVLTAEAGNAVNDANIGNGIVGTGYNDTFFATLGTDKYEGGGGTVTISGVKSWSDIGGMDIVDYKLAGNTAVTVDLSNKGMQNTGFGVASFSNIEGIAGGNGNDTFTDDAGDNIFNGRGGNDTFNLLHGGHDTLLYTLLNSADATGGNGWDVANGFKVGTFEATPNSDRIDLAELLIGYTPASADGFSARYINGVATINEGDRIGEYLSVTKNGPDTVISIDRDGAGGQFAMATLITLHDVQTDLATLLANHQIVVC